MKKITSILFLLAVCTSYSQIVKRNIGAKHIEYNENDSSTPTASDYVQDGLIAMWDGIENVGWGEHDELALSWTELISGSTNIKVVSPRFWSCSGDSLEVPENMILENLENANVRNPIPMSTILNVVTAEFIAYKTIKNAASGNMFAGWHTCYSSYFGFGFVIDEESEPYERFSITINCSSSGSLIIQRSNIHIDLSGGTTRANNSYAFWGFKRTLLDPHVGICSIRFYNRLLSQEEIEHNKLIDKVRFGL